MRFLQLASFEILKQSSIKSKVDPAQSALDQLSNNEPNYVAKINFAVIVVVSVIYGTTSVIQIDGAFITSVWLDE